MTAPFSYLKINAAGWYEIRWSEPNPYGLGQRSRTQSTRTKDPAIAQAVHRRWRAEHAALAAGVPLPGPAEDVAGGLAAYGASLAARGVAGTQTRCLALLEGYFGASAPSELTDELVAGYRLYRAGVCDDTLRRELGVLSAALRWAWTNKRITEPAPTISLPPAGAPRFVFLPEDVEADLFRTAANDIDLDTGRLSRVGRFICIGLDTGARKSAILGLTHDRVDLVTGMIDFRDSAVRVTKKRRPVTPITSRLRPVMERIARERRKRGSFVLDTDTDIKHQWAAFMSKHGFEGVTPHVLKHTRITLLLRAGVQPWDVSALTATSEEVIRTVYGHHVQDDRLRQQADRRYTPPAVATVI